MGRGAGGGGPQGEGEADRKELTPETWLLGA